MFLGQSRVGCDVAGGSCIQGISQRFQHPQAWDVHQRVVGYMGVPPNGWLIRHNPNLKWMMTGGTTILGNHHMENRPMGFGQLWFDCLKETSAGNYNFCDQVITFFGAKMVLNLTKSRKSHQERWGTKIYRHISTSYINHWCYDTKMHIWILRLQIGWWLWLRFERWTKPHEPSFRSFGSQWCLWGVGGGGPQHPTGNWWKVRNPLDINRYIYIDIPIDIIDRTDIDIPIDIPITSLR